MDDVSDKISNDSTDLVVTEYEVDLPSDDYLERAVVSAKASLLRAIEENDVEGALEVTAMESILTMRRIMHSARLDPKRQKLAADIAKDMAHMAGYKPVERRLNINKNIGIMNERELDSMIISAFNRDEKLVKLVEEGKDGIGEIRCTDGVGEYDKGREAEVSEVNTEEEASS